jgi:hypothetical protein
MKYGIGSEGNMEPDFKTNHGKINKSGNYDITKSRCILPRTVVRLLGIPNAQVLEHRWM